MISDIHEREVGLPAAELGMLVDKVAEQGNVLWPARWWYPMILDRPLAEGARGGHGPVRYFVVAHEPQRRVQFAFTSVFGVAIRGSHSFEVHPTTDPRRARLQHVLVVESTMFTWPLWHLLIRPVHDAMLEDALDNVAEVCGEARIARWSPVQRLLNFVLPYLPISEPLRTGQTKTRNPEGRTREGAASRQETE